MYYGQFELDRVLHETFFKEKRNGFFVECGAWDGLTESTCKFFEETMGWSGMNIEPAPASYRRLINNRPNSINVNKALSSVTEVKTFTNALHPDMGDHFGNGSLNHTNQHKQELVDMGCKFETFEVSCTTFHQIYEEHQLKEIDLFVLDVEGHEIEALKGIITLPFEAQPKVFCIEHSFSGSNEISEMLKKHYTFHSKSHHNAFFVKNENA